MFTTRPPHVTGVMFGSRDQYLEDEELLLAEIAQQQGIKTGAVLSNAVLGSATNFGQGFDDYIETYKILQGSLGARADTVTTAAARWLGGRTSDEPFFLWVHYVDPHATYEPPSEYAQPFFEDELYDATLLRLNDDTNFNSGVAGRYWRRNGGQREHGWYVANYDGEVAYTDAEIGRLLDVIEARGLLSNSVVVFTADHGESLGDHDYFFEHGWYPYNATAWIPFVVYWPGVPEPGRRVTYPVGLINLVPTLVDLMGWQISEPVPFHGRSLVPVLRGERDRVDDYVVVEAGEGGFDRASTYVPSRMVAGNSFTVCVATFKKRQESDGSGRAGAVSCNHPEQLVDELNLSPTIRTAHQHLGPAGERQIGRHDQAPALVAAADEAEQQVGAGLVERHVAELVEDDDIEAGELVEFPGQPPLLLRFDEQRGQLGGRQEPDPIVVLAAGHAQGDGEMGLAGTDAADQHDVGSLGDEGAAAHLQDRIAVHLRLRVELEGIQGLEHREAGLLEAALDAALAAPGHFQVHQLREVLRGRLALAGAGRQANTPPSCFSFRGGPC